MSESEFDFSTPEGGEAAFTRLKEIAQGLFLNINLMDIRIKRLEAFIEKQILIQKGVHDNNEKNLKIHF